VEQTISYKKAPLVELIVEIQWPVQTIGIPGGLPIIGGTSAVFDLWFQKLTGALNEQGFHNLERLVPHDMPPMAHQILYRYKKTNEQFPIVQFGHGIFTVNAGPPQYQSWETFRPQVEQALKALLDNKPGDLELKALSRASLRYIDAFGEELRQGASNYAFMRDEIGVTANLPKGLLNLATDENEINPTVAFRFPVKDDENATLAFQIAAGRLGNSSSTDTLMDITYLVGREIDPTVESVLAILDKARGTIHAWFEKLTAKLHDRMEPITES